MSTTKRKYLLFSADDGRPDVLKSCAFFASDQGCRNGAACKFKHDNAPGTVPAVSNPEPEVAKKSVADDNSNPRNKGEKRAHTIDDQPQKQQLLYSNELERQKLEIQKEYENKLKSLMNVSQVKVSQKATEQNTANSKSQPISNNNTNREFNNQDDSANKRAKIRQNKTPVKTAPVANNSRSSFQPLINDSFLQSHSKPEVSRSNAKTDILKLNSKVQPPTSARQAEDEDGDDDDGDDDNFIFQAVNSVIATSASNPNDMSFSSPVFAPPGFVSAFRDGMQLRSRSNSYDNGKTPIVAAFYEQHSTNSPFLQPENVLEVLKTSKSDHALYGSKSAAKAEKIQQKAATTQISAGKGLSWEEMVTKTRAHQKYKSSYSFDTKIAADPSAWVRAKAPGDWCNNLPAILAVDCEMCESQDPITDEKDGCTLIRLSVVNGMNPNQTLIDTLVQPSWPITNMRSNIHGITAAILKNASSTANLPSVNTPVNELPICSLRQAQAKLMGICTSSTILVGQSLYNDLTALKFDHSLVVDTAYLFEREGSSTDSPSLREIAKQVLNTTLPDIHDSVRDAAMAMMIANFVNKNGCQVPTPRLSSTSAVNDAGTGNNLRQKELLVHRIPASLSDKDIFSMMTTHTNIVPAYIDPIARSQAASSNNGNDNGKTCIRFTTAAHCDLAFDSISGPNRPDKSNAPQKRVYLKSGGYICVRKFV